MGKFKYFYLIQIEYLGYRFHGWQKQPNLKTVHLMIDRTIKYILQQDFKTLGSGRTDALVSAENGAFELFTKVPIENTKLFFDDFNKNLPQDIRGISIKEVNNKFNIINSPKIKEYRYLFSQGEKNHPFCAPLLTTFLDPLDISLMKKGAKIFEGTHNFKSYCYKPSENGKYIRNIEYCSIKKNNKIIANFFPKDTFEFIIRAKGFMRNQVRLMMGVLVELGRGDVDLEYIKDSLKKYNSEINYIAPSSGLRLHKITFID